ncbi:bacillithiol biosynthesis deacetylase BshB1 [Putridiphycobacter roseus]|uniref:Bacillithiol biosynthesis deacetylase BshB1 n=1 Tax=Putridiphycobacter roseus TaxID=2219161 RepID=A0A2W1NEV1_9FLAO|nr:bacillithiol biosynthesis deacetylase BshB1 [Putridiphycobacter roseus]PZE17985.1 bacillithiol biosynthesis deacetylase BshB1 [Putridiphycobacter roseus]
MQVDILAFGAHPDDVEISASGTIIKHIEMGKTVAIVDLTQGELGSRGTIETRYAEAAAAIKILGVHARENLKMADGFFTISEENKLKIVEQIRRFQPKIVLANAISDRHPDHGRASQLVREACFLAGLKQIKTSWEGKEQKQWRPKSVYFYIQDRYIKPDFIVDISEQVEKKIASIRAYKTQFFNPDSTAPLTPISGEDFFDFLRGRWKEFGRTIGTSYGEGFTVERTPGVNDITELV